jgi:DNA (cytosine-5)-methyltransferase 1
MNLLSVCSGIGAPEAAWTPLGWDFVACSEIEPFPSAVLEHHYPDVPNWGDMTKFKEWPDASIDVLVGGTPCQSFSVAGLRKGLDDPRGNLALTYLAIADRYRPRWLVWENVPGVLSSNGGRDFGAFLGGLGEIGYGFAYRVLDAQYFGLAQRRKRVFVVGYLGDWRRAAAVLFERESLSGHPAPCREAGEGFAAATAPSLTASGRGVARTGESRGQDPVVAMCLSAKGGSGRFDAESETFIAFNARQDPTVSGDITEPLGAKDTGHGVATKSAVRRLTPLECERLQGFPDGYTDVAYRKKPAADGPRYKALGNSMAVPVVRWIGERIEMVDALSVPRHLKRQELDASKIAPISE